MKKLFLELKRCLLNHENTVLVTIIASSGSTPRGAGSRMLVKSDGSIVGTIGGGIVEHKCIQKAMDALQKGVSSIEGFTLAKDEVYKTGNVSGGNVDVYMQFMDSDDPSCLSLCDDIIDALDTNEDCWLILDISDHTCWHMGLYSASQGLRHIEVDNEIIDSLEIHRAYQKSYRDKLYYLEPLIQSGFVYVFGGGHVAQALVPVLTFVGFRCIVMDDREQFANKDVFPDAIQTIVGDMEHIDQYVHIQKTDYVCIMSRGHQYDLELQKQVLSARPKYLGMIGSRRKIAHNKEVLLQCGFSEEEIDACHMPIGLDIKAVTPQEIAISIVAEMIMIRAKQSG